VLETSNFILGWKKCTRVDDDIKSDVNGKLIFGQNNVKAAQFCLHKFYWFFILNMKIFEWK